MSDLEKATANTENAQARLEQVRAEELGAYDQDEWLEGREHVVVAAGEDVTPEAANEDAIWEAAADHDPHASTAAGRRPVLPGRRRALGRVSIS